MGGWQGIADKRGRFDTYRTVTAFTLAQVRSTRVINGRVYVDAESLAGTTGYWRTCPLMVFGGGPGRFFFAPVAEGAEGDLTQAGLDTISPTDTSAAQVLLLHRTRGKPYAIGVAQHPNMTLVAEIAEDDASADHGGAISKNDFAMQNAGAKVIVDANGSVTLIAGDSGMARVQLPEETGALRISRDGEAEERVLLANAFLDKYVNGDLFDHLEAQDARIAALEAQVTAISTILTTGGLPVVGSATGPSPVPGIFTPAPASSAPVAFDDVISATVHLASRSEADG